jgi:GTP cyclohydrolase II
MFSYIDPTIRSRLVEQGKLIRIDATGATLAPDQVGSAPGATLNVLGPIPLPMDVGGKRETFQWYAFVRHTELAEANRIADALRGRGEQHLFSVLSNNMSVNSVLVMGDLRAADNPLVRVHSCCLTGDVFGSMRCECGPQLDRAFKRIEAEGTGAVIYMSGHEGRGIGLWAKAITYMLQDAGEDTYQANRSLGLPDDSRDFGDAAAMLLHLRGGDKPIRLMSNNPKKHKDLRAGGLSHIQPEAHVTGVSAANQRYLKAKRGWGHLIDLKDIEGAGDTGSAGTDGGKAG